jgi:hypothetical protein
VKAARTGARLSAGLAMAAMLLGAGAAPLRADAPKPNLTGTWKLDQTKGTAGHGGPELRIAIDQTDDAIHIKETRGANTKGDVSEFTCNTLGNACKMNDGGEKARVTVYFNGPTLVVLKTHGRRGSSIVKQRLSLAPSGDALVVEILPIEPQGKTEKLLLSKSQ